ncbi:histidine kinase [Saxibacter everestensis]|uniref:histidine kinase n=1 Tax=Saxibacter everestensis TaxID=2909229 RepID=A0ABY8QXG6_9MICO|nr:histidine kinase [Brevibacteriaceae bacterium ZFBP1038]
MTERGRREAQLPAMRGRSSVLRVWRARLASRQRLVHHVVAGALTLAIIVTTAVSWVEVAPARGRELPAAALVLAACTAMFLARRHPIPATALSLLASAVYYPLSAVDGPLLIAFVFSLFVLARHGRYVVAALFAIAEFGIVLLGELGPVRHLSNLEVMLLEGWLVAIIAVGVIVNNRTELVRRAEKEATDAERLRIAREIHDVIAHRISLINVQATAALRRGDPERSQQALQVIRDASKTTLTETRSVLGMLRSAELNAGSAGNRSDPRLRPAAGIEDLPALVEDFASSGIDISLEVPSDIEVAPEAARAVYRFCQESLANVIRHSAASKAQVRLEVEGRLLRCVVEDNGRGGRVLPGNGIRGMMERARLLQGSVDFANATPSGIRASLTIPIASEQRPTRTTATDKKAGR